MRKMKKTDLRALSLLLRIEMESKCLVNCWALVSASLPLPSSLWRRRPRRLARLAARNTEHVMIFYHKTTRESKQLRQYQTPLSLLCAPNLACNVVYVGEVKAHIASGIHSCC